MIEFIDHEKLAISRLATQYRESTNLIAYIKALLLESNTLEQTLHDIIELRYLDTATGAQLDVLGEIVGQARELVNSSVLFYFGFLGDPSSQSFGDLNDPSVGGRFRSLGESVIGNRLLEDDEYRFYIRCRIAKNKITPTVDNMAELFNFIFKASSTHIYEGVMSYIVSIGRLLTANEKVFLLNGDVVPKVAAVRVEYRNFDAESAFGFLGVPNSKGFGTLADPTVGGKFASVII